MSRSLSISTAIAIAVLSASLTANSQTDVMLLGGMNFPSGTFSHSAPAWPLPAFWNPGFSVGASLETHLSRIVSVVPSFEYAHYPWRLETAVEWDPVIYNAPYGPGTPSRMYRFNLDARLYVFSKERFGIFLSTGAGYVIEKIGSYDLSPWYVALSSVLIDRHVQYPLAYYWAHEMGVGAHFFLSGNVGLDFTAKYLSNYTDRFHTSLSLGVFYRVAD